jgi:hypothetical protein
MAGSIGDIRFTPKLHLAAENFQFILKLKVNVAEQKT